MPYIDESRLNTTGIPKPPRRLYWKYNGTALPWTSAPLTDYLFGRERIWSYRTGRDISTQYSRKDLTGEQIRNLVYHNQAFELDMLGGIIETGEPESNKTLYPYDTGHNLRQLKSSIVRAGVHYLNAYSRVGLNSFAYSGPIWLTDATTSPFLLPSWTDTAESTSDYNRANRAMARMTPVAPSSNFIRAVGELMKDGLPMLTGMSWTQAYQRSAAKVNGIVVGRRTLPVSQTANEYLNYQFGVASTISDLQKTARSVKRSKELVDRLNKVVNGDSKIYRRYANIEDVKDTRTVNGDVRFNTETASVSTPSMYYSGDRFAYLFKPLNSYPLNQHKQNLASGSTTWLLKRQTDVVCAFSLFQQDLNDLAGRFQHYSDQADLLLGMKLDADTAFQLTRWSWITNWFFDLGGMISRAEALASDSIALRYGYITKSYDVIKAISTDAGPQFLSNGGVFHPLATITEHRSFSRWRATPYGFGLSVADFSPAKWAILASLGISRGSSALRLREIP